MPEASGFIDTQDAYWNQLDEHAHLTDKTRHYGSRESKTYRAQTSPVSLSPTVNSRGSSAT